MPEVAAVSGADFIKGDGVGCRVREDGRLELANRNDLPNSDLRRFSGNSITPDHVAIYRPERPVGWGVYIRDLSSASNKTSRQNINMLDLGKDDYYQVGPLVSGAPPPDPTQQSKIPPPTFVRVTAESDGQVGLVAGWSAWAFGWIVARRGRNPSCEVLESPILTAPSPRRTVNLSSGQCVRLTLPETAPQGAVGIYIAGVVGQSSSGNANSARLHVIRRIDISRGLDREYLVDRFAAIGVCPTANNTYCGTFEQLPPCVRYWHKVGANQGLKSFTTRLCYRFQTQHGWSEWQQMTGVINTAARAGEKVRLSFIPESLPSNALMWEPAFLGRDGHTWWAMDIRNPTRWARMRSNIPEDFPDADEPERVRECLRDRDPQRPDRTGLPNPTAPFPGASAEGKPELPPGSYRCYVVFFDEDGRQTALSPPQDITFALGQRLRVERPRYGNWIPNATGFAIDASTGLPRGWTLVGSTSAVLRVDPPLFISQTANATSNVTVATLPLTPIHETAAQGTRNTTIRVLWRFTRYVSGHLRPGIRFFDVNGTEIGSETAFPTNAGALGDVDMTYSIARSGVGAQITIPDNATHYRITIRSHGSASARNFDVEVLAVGAFPGSVAPRTLPEGFQDMATVPAVEGDTDQYPNGAYAVVVKNPVDRPSALNAFTLNSFAYFAPLGTPVHSRNGIRGWLHPVRGAEIRTASVYARWEGIATPSPNAMPILSLDRHGRALQFHGGLLNITAGTSAWTRRTRTYTTHPDAAYAYFPIGNLGDGEVVLAGFQDEDGSSASTYSNEGVSAGDWSITLDTGIPGVDEGSVQDFLNLIHRFERAGAVYTDDTDDDSESATTVLVSVRTSATDDPFLWSNYYTDLAAVPKLRYWQIKVNLSTTDISRTPVVDWMGVHFIRPYGVLLRVDGTEFTGGCVVQSMPPIPERRKRQEFVTDDNSWVLSFSGNYRREIDDVTLLCFTRETAEEIMKYQDSGDPFLLESYPKRRSVLFWPSNISFQEDPGTRTYDELAPDYYWEDQVADGVSGHVSDQEVIATQ